MDALLGAEDTYKRKSLMDFHGTLAENKKRRHHELHRSQHALCGVLAKTPTYQVLEDRYRHSVELPELQRRKEALALKRELMSPISMHVLGQHTKQYSCSLKELSEKRAERFRRRKLSLAAHEASLKYYTPKVAAILQQEQTQTQEASKLTALQKEILREKGKRYGTLARELFKPTVSPAKQKAVQQATQRFPSTRHRAPTGATGATGATGFLSKQPSLVQKSPYDWAHSARKQLKGPVKRPLPITPEPPSVIDYLNDRRKQREAAKRTGTFQLQDYHWQQTAQDPLLNTPERLGQLSKKSRKLENQARSCEYLLGGLPLHDLRSVEANELVTNAYLQSVNAKLALLNSYAS